ncbi:MAG: L-lactate dehydrogenase [Oscillospiraceae bacterium]|nr:L-lactate dehydrogenase [Oscillospiraceae bacterium]
MNGNRKGSKITIIGAGNVGATIGYTLAVSGMASEIVFTDVNNDKAVGEAMDIIHGSAFLPPVNIYAGQYADAVDSDIVIVTAGVGRKPGQSRTDLAQINIGIFKTIFPTVVNYAPNAIYVIVSNPVDILTYAAIKYSGLPAAQIIGSGTMLDSSRLRTAIAASMGINAHDVHAFVLGEHGNTAMIPWSNASVAGTKIETYFELTNKCDGEDCNVKEDLDKLLDGVIQSGAEVIKRKGATYYAIGLAVRRICEAILRDSKSVLAVSNMMHGQYGIEDVCISLPYVIGSKGIIKEFPIVLTKEEEDKIRASADSLKSIMSTVDI